MNPLNFYGNSWRILSQIEGYVSKKKSFNKHSDCIKRLDLYHLILYHPVSKHESNPKTQFKLDSISILTLISNQKFSVPKRKIEEQKNRLLIITDSDSGGKISETLGKSRQPSSNVSFRSSPVISSSDGYDFGNDIVECNFLRVFGKIKLDVNIKLWENSERETTAKITTAPKTGNMEQPVVEVLLEKPEVSIPSAIPETN